MVVNDQRCAAPLSSAPVRDFILMSQECKWHRCARQNRGFRLPLKVLQFLQDAGKWLKKEVAGKIRQGVREGSF
jgi:hypothetical protein